MKKIFQESNESLCLLPEFDGIRAPSIVGNLKIDRIYYTIQ